MEFGSLDGVDEVEYNGVGFVEISKIFVTQDIHCITIPSHRIKTLVTK